MKYACSILPRIAVLAAILIETGCQRLPDPPEGFPQLYPCTITATFGGEAIEGVNVSMKSEDPTIKWQSGGKTDAKGIAKMKTSFAYDGVPIGKFVVSFEKLQQREGNTIQDMASLSLIPLKYGPGKSKVIVEVKPEKTRFTFALDGGQEIETGTRKK